MTEHHFAQQYLGTFCGDGREPLRQLAERAVDRMKWYDERTSRHRKEHEVTIPVEWCERQECVSYAKIVRDGFGHFAQRLSYSPEDWRDEMRRANERYDRLARERARER